MLSPHAQDYVFAEQFHRMYEDFCANEEREQGASGAAATTAAGAVALRGNKGVAM